MDTQETNQQSSSQPPIVTPPPAETPPVQAPKSHKKMWVIAAIVLLVLMLGGGGVFVASKTMVPAPTPTPTRKPTPTVTAIPSPTPTATPSPKLAPISKTPVKIQPPVTSAASPTPNPNAEFGFDLSTRSMQIQVKKGTCAQAFTFTSKGSTSWSIQSFDTWGGGHPIYWDKLNGGASNGETIAMQVCAKPDAQSYPGWGSNTNGINFTDNTSGKSVNLQVSYQISE